MLDQSEKLGVFNHAFTYSGHPLSAAIALEVQKIYQEIDVVATARRLGARLGEALEPLAGHPLVGDVSRVGLMAGIELMRVLDCNDPIYDGDRVVTSDAARVGFLMGEVYTHVDDKRLREIHRKFHPRQ